MSYPDDNVSVSASHQSMRERLETYFADALRVDRRHVTVRIPDASVLSTKITLASEAATARNQEILMRSLMRMTRLESSTELRPEHTLSGALTLTVPCPPDDLMWHVEQQNGIA